MRERQRLVGRIVATLAAVILGHLAQAQERSVLESVASTPKNGLEGLDVAADGSLYVTDASAHVIHKISRSGAVSDFAVLSVVPQVILLTRSGAIFTAQKGEPDFVALRAPAAPAAAATGTTPAAPASPPRTAGFTAAAMGNLGAVLVLLDKQGHVVKTIEGTSGAFFNGLARLGSTYLIADSTAGVLWQFDPARSAITPWLKDDALLGPDGRFPGANGIKVVHGRVYVSNTVAGLIYRIATRHGKPKGTLAVVAHLSAPDDFAVASNGTIYAPSAGAVLKIAPSGETSTLLTGCVGCDAAVLTDHDKSLLLVTHGFGAAAGSGHVYRIKLKS